MNRAGKIKLVEELAERIKAAKSFVALDYQGLPTKEVTHLRKMVSGAGGNMLVVKNTLLKLALAKAQDVTHTKDEIELTGPTAVVFAERDEIAPLQAIGKFIKEMELPKLKFGIFGGEMLDSNKVSKLSELPSREVLSAQLLGTMTSPIYGLVGTLQGKMQELIYILGEHLKAQNSKGKTTTKN